MSKVYEYVTEKIVAKLEEGVVPWQKPWNPAIGQARNFNSNRPYRGVNQFLLNMMPFGSPFYATYKGWCKAAGISDKDRTPILEKGQSGTMVVFWKLIDSKTEPDRKIPLLRYFTVFNYEQLNDDMKSKITIEAAGETAEFDPLDEAEAVIDQMQNPPNIRHGFNAAFYTPSTDEVCLPNKEAFNAPAGYYATAFHELVHSTGHSTRLKRGIETNAGFGSETYSKEELVAEMGATMLCGVVGIENDVIDNSAAYIKTWIGRLKDDPKLIVQAAAQAQKAADYILNVKFEKKEEVAS